VETGEIVALKIVNNNKGHKNVANFEQEHVK